MASDGVATGGIDIVGVEVNFSSSDGLGFASDGVLLGYSSLFSSISLSFVSSLITSSELCIIESSTLFA